MPFDDLHICEEKIRVTFLTHKKALLIAISGGEGSLNTVTGIYNKPIDECFSGKASKIAKEYGFDTITTSRFSEALSLLNKRDDIIGLITCDWLDNAPGALSSYDFRGKDLARHALEKGIPSAVVCPDRYGHADLLFTKKRGFNKKTIGGRYLPERTSFWREVVVNFIFHIGNIKKKD